MIFYIVMSLSGCGKTTHECVDIVCPLGIEIQQIACIVIADKNEIAVCYRSGRFSDLENLYRIDPSPTAKS